MARYEVRCEVDVPDEIASQVSFNQISDWVRFNLHENSSLGPSPIQNLDLEAVPFSVDIDEVPDWKLKRRPAPPENQQSVEGKFNA